MKKAIRVLTNIAIIFISLISNILIVQGSQNEGAWVLVEVIDFDSKEDIAKYNKDYEGIYQYEGNYSRNNFTYTWTYVGKSDDDYDPPQINGESASFTASFSQPPQVINVGEEITINMSLSAATNLSFYTPLGMARSQIGKTGQSFGDFTNEKGEASFKTDSKNNYASFNETVTAVAPGGSEGETLEIRLYLSNGNHKQETRYIYEWKEGEAVPEIGEDAPPEPTRKPPTPEPYRRENCKDSGVRFSDLAGDVQVRPDDNIIGWEWAEMDNVLCVMDHVKTEDDSSALLSLSDMTIFEMRPSSEIVLNTESERESKIALLAGKIWVNVKRMVKDGSMSVEMSQAVAGIKGTTLVLEEDGTTSTLKVLEGTVEFTSYAGESILVTDGQTVSVTDGTFGEVTSFSIEEEMKNWGASRTNDGSYTIESEIYKDNSVAQEKAPKTGTVLILTLLCFGSLGLLIVAAVVIVLLVLKRKKKENQ